MGYVIGVVVVGCVLIIILFFGVFYYFKCWNKNFNVFKVEEISFYNIFSESKYLIIFRGNGVLNRGLFFMFSSYSIESKDSIKNIKWKMLFFLKMFWVFWKFYSFVEVV